MKDINFFFRNTTGVFLHYFNHILAVKGWKNVLVAASDYTRKFSAVSSKVVVSITGRTVIVKTLTMGVSTFLLEEIKRGKRRVIQSEIK